jgi:hypothetical protein
VSDPKDKEKMVGLVLLLLGRQISHGKKAA